MSAGLFEGKNTQIEKAIIETETGDYQLIDPNFFKFSDSLFASTPEKNLEEHLQKKPHTPLLLLKTAILHPDGAQELTLFGIDYPSHEKLFPLKSYVSGSWPPKEFSEVVIGKTFADKLNLSIGDNLVITYQDRNKAILNESLVIVGIFERFGTGFEARNAYVHKDLLIKILSIDHPNSFHKIVVLGNELDSPPQGLVKKTWSELFPELNVLMKFHDGVTRTLIIFMLLIAFVAIFTPISILWEERKDEVKLLQTIGASNKMIYQLATTEAGVITMLSLSLSLLIWSVLHLWFSRNGLDFSVLGEKVVSRGGINISPIVYPTISRLHNTLIFIFHGVLIFSSQLWCIRKLLLKETIRG
jgi:ABC-type lipoprotein release transport system permease subunit